MDELTFCLAGAENAEEIYALYCRCKCADSSDWDETYPTMEFVERDLAQGTLYCLTAETGKIVAAATAGEDPEMDEDHIPWSRDIRRPCSLSRLCVEPALQGHGLASSLLQVLEQKAAQQGYDGVRLWASKANPAAVALYRGAGYNCCGELRKYETDFYCFEHAIKR